MKLELTHAVFPFELLTPCLCGGAENEPPMPQGRQPLPDRPRPPLPGTGSLAELRIASIRGQVREWHRNADLQPPSNEVWGVATNASRVSLALQQEHTATGKVPARILPHAGKDTFGSRNPWAKAESHRNALSAGQQFTLVLTRFPACSRDQWVAAQNAVKVWLLVGCLGVRANRAAGSVWPLPSEEWPKPPSTRDELKGELKSLGFSWAVSLAGEAARKEPDELRTTASDTVNNVEHFGDAGRKRIPSPARFKVIRIGGGYCLLVTAAHKPNGQSLLPGAYDLLKSKPRWQTLAPWQPLLP